MQAVFTYQFRGENLHADAVKVRRLLLANTDGRAWSYIRDLAVEKARGEELRGQLTATNGGDAELEALIAVNRVQVANLEGTLAQAAIVAFEFAPFDPRTGDGATEMDALGVLQQYMDFAAGKG